MAGPKRILIVGGVAGGASCAARLRRLCEKCEIVVFDRGGFVSFANCGLPYFVGDVIKEEKSLLVASPELFQNRFNIQVQLEHEVLAIHREEKQIVVRDLRSGLERREPYDALVLSPGAKPVRPNLPGIDLPGIFALRTIPDSRKIRTWIDERRPKKAVVVGAGFIGLEMAENLFIRGLEVTLLEKAQQVMPPFDPEMAAPLQQHLESRGLRLVLGDGLARFEEKDGLRVVTESAQALPADLVILALGVRPESDLARRAGLRLGARGGIQVDSQMRTSDPAIWAVGDAIESADFVTGQELIVPLAGPANRQGRVAAEGITGRQTRFRGTQATAVCGVLGLTVATTGASEKGLRRCGIGTYEKVYLHPGHHAGYFPGAKPIHLKLLFATPDGRVLGAQAVGEEGVEKRIDVIATAIQMRATVRDLAEAELCYAPQFGAAKDPVNLAGMIASNVLDGDMPLADWEKISSTEAVLLDVRDADEFEEGHIPGARNIPLAELRHRLSELPAGREIWLYCGVGQRAYFATRLLMQQGHQVRNLSGGIRTWRALQSSGHA